MSDLHTHATRRYEVAAAASDYYHNEPAVANLHYAIAEEAWQVANAIERGEDLLYMPAEWEAE